MAKTDVGISVDMTVAPGKLEEFEAAAQAMLEATRKERGVLAYDFFLSPDRSRCRLIEVYDSAASALAHFKGPVVGELVPKLLASVSLDGMECYGDPGPELAAMLAGFGAQTFALRFALKG